MFWSCRLHRKAWKSIFYPSGDKYGMIEERSALGTRAPSGSKQPHYTPVLNVNLTQQPEHRHFTMFNFVLSLS